MLEFFEGKGTLILSIGGSIMSFLIGAWDLPLQILLVAIVMDYLCGTMKAFYTGDISSKVGYKGLIKKVGIIFMVVVGQLADLMLGIAVIRNAVCLAYAVNELWSICENVAIMDIYIPPFIKDNLAQIKEVVENISVNTGKKK